MKLGKNSSLYIFWNRLNNTLTKIWLKISNLLKNYVILHFNLLIRTCKIYVSTFQKKREPHMMHLKVPNYWDSWKYFRCVNWKCGGVCNFASPRVMNLEPYFSSCINNHVVTENVDYANSAIFSLEDMSSLNDLQYS